MSGGILPRRRVAAAVGVLGSVVTAFFACALDDVDFSGKACPCGVGYVCDSSQNVCVREGTDASRADGSVVGPTSDSPQGCSGDQCSCSADVDCVDPLRSKCSPDHVCVDCVAGSGDSCRSGSYCNAQGQCVLGCKQESDCQISPGAPHCDSVRHQCVECRTVADCPQGDQCSPSGQCVEGCDLDAGKTCAGGRACCDRLCIDTSKDPLNCGGCGVACSAQNGTPTCALSTCSWTCASGFGHCASGNTGCESNLRTDVNHCGSCAVDCNALVVNANNVMCSLGGCGYQTCKANFLDCDGFADSGCECPCGAAQQKCCAGDVCNQGLSCKGGGPSRRCQ